MVVEVFLYESVQVSFGVNYKEMPGVTNEVKRLEMPAANFLENS